MTKELTFNKIYTTGTCVVPLDKDSEEVAGKKKKECTAIFNKVLYVQDIVMVKTIEQLPETEQGDIFIDGDFWAENVIFSHTPK